MVSVYLAAVNQYEKWLFTFKLDMSMSVFVGRRFYIPHPVACQFDSPPLNPDQGVACSIASDVGSRCLQVFKVHNRFNSYRYRFVVRMTLL